MNQAAGLLKADGPRAVILVRLAVGAVFLSEGIGKFLYPGQQAVGRFAKIAIPAPEVFGPLSAVAETSCGVLLLLGLFTRLAVLPPLVTMVLALALTKVPILSGGSADKPQANGLWGRGARGPHRLGDAAGSDAPVDHRAGAMVAGHLVDP